MSTNLGINLVEVNGATPSIQGAPTSVAGFIVRSQRGVPGVVRQVSSFAQFTDYFGGYVAAGNSAPGTVDGTQTSYVGAYAVRGFFDNGGTLAYVYRVVDPLSAKAATTSFQSSVGNPPTPISLTAAFRGQADPGVWGNGIAVAIVPNTSNPAVTDAFDVTVAQIVTVNGSTTYRTLESWTKISLGGAPGYRLPQVINDPNTGSKYVMIATGAVSQWAQNTAYAVGNYVSNGGTIYVATAAGTSANSPGGPTGTGTSVSDGSVTWAYVPPVLASAWQTNHSYGTGSYVINGGKFYQATPGGVSAPNGPAGPGPTSTDGTVTWALVPASPASWQASQAYTVGQCVTNGGNVYVVITAGTSAASGGPTGMTTNISDGPDTLKWSYVPAGGAAWQATHAYTVGAAVSNYGDLFVAIVAGTSGAISTGPTGTGANIADGGVTWAYVAIPSYTPLAQGAEDNLVGGAGGSLDTAIAAAVTTPSPFDSIPVQLLACPETADAAVVQAALTYCANRGDCMFVGHVPDGGAQPLAAAKAYGQSLQGDKVYGAVYMPFIQVVDPIGSLIWIPPTGHVLGVYARTDQQRGVWKAPAGDAALVNNALNVRATLNDTDFTDLVKNGSVNAIRPITGAGIVVDSSRTLSTNTLWLYVNVRLLFNFVKTSLRLGLRWVVQEPNDVTLWNKIKFNSVTPFLMGLWRRGAFGTGAPADVFTVKVDAVNNQPASVQQGILNVEVYFYPSRPAETIVITVGQKDGAATAGES